MKDVFFAKKNIVNFTILQCPDCGAGIHFAGESYTHECGVISPAPPFFPVAVPLAESQPKQNI